MAGDWIKMRLDLRDDPSVFMVSAALSCEVDLVVGKLHRLWSWFNQQTRDGSAPLMTAEWVDKYLDRPGFAQALAEAGWLVLNSPQGVQIPNFERHMGQCAKRRIDANARKQSSRTPKLTDDSGVAASGCDTVTKSAGRADVAKCDTVTKTVVRADASECDTVTKSSGRAGGLECDTSLPREEKSREEGEKRRAENWRAEKKEDDDESTEPPDAACDSSSSSILLSFPTIERDVQWHLTSEQLQRWSKRFPTIDVLADCHRALAFLEDNPEKLHKPADTRRYVRHWLSRTSLRVESTTQARPPETRIPTDDDLANWTPNG